MKTSNSQTTVSSFEWPWIENTNYVEFQSLGFEEGNKLDFKLTVFADYLRGNTKTKPTAPNTPSDPVDYAKVGLRLTEYLISFLNSNGGCLLFGVSDDGKVHGMCLTEKQRDKIRLAFDNSIRNYSITPQPATGVDYRLEFVPVVLQDNGPTDSYVLVLEVKKSSKFHYAHISKQLQSWERLNASNVCLCDHPERFVKRLQELRNTFTDTTSIQGIHFREATTGYITILFSDTVLYCSEKVLSLKGTHTRMYRLDEFSALDDKGRFIIDRPSKYFKALYDYLQIGVISIHISDYPILIAEANFYGILEIVPSSSVPDEEKSIKRVVGEYVTLFSPAMIDQAATMFH